MFNQKPDTSKNQAYTSGRNTFPSRSEMSSEPQTTMTSWSGELAGIFQGVQESYKLENGNVTDSVAKGKQLIIPSTYLKFTIKQNGNATLEQRKENDIANFFNGYVVLQENTSKATKVQFMIDHENIKSDTSFETYILTFSKTTKSITCSSANGPETFLTRM